MKRILFILDNPGLYGSELHVLSLVMNLKRIYKITVMVFKEGPLISILSEMDIRVICLEIGYKFTLKQIKSIQTEISEINPDIIHAHQPKALFIFSILKIFNKQKYIITVHSQALDHSLIYKGLKRFIVYIFHSVNNFVSQMMADEIVFVSDFMFNKSHFKKKSHIVYNWLRPNLLEKKKQEQLKKTLNKSKINILSIGSVTKSKGFDIFFEFLQKLSMIKDLDFTVSILGDIDELFLNNLNLNEFICNKVNFVGYCSNVEEYYASSDIFILFSRTETFGMVYLEAMAFGLPIICGDIPALRALLPRGNSLTFNLDEQVDFFLELFNDEDLYKQVSKKNEETALGKYSLEHSLKKMQDIYELVK